MSYRCPGVLSPTKIAPEPLSDKAFAKLFHDLPLAALGLDEKTVADLARAEQIPPKFLELILANLKQGGFVESRRGAEGGYLLARRAESIPNSA